MERRIGMCALVAIIDYNGPDISLSYPSKAPQLQIVVLEKDTAEAHAP